MTMQEEYGRCRACGAVCDGDVCDQYCYQDLVAAERADDDAIDPRNDEGEANERDEDQL